MKPNTSNNKHKTREEELQEELMKRKESNSNGDYTAPSIIMIIEAELKGIAEGKSIGYAKALKQALAKHFELSTISWVDWIKREIRKNA